MNAAVLGLPIDNNLGYSAIIPYGKKAQFQIMIKGYIQLAIDTGLYKSIHVTEVYSDEFDYHDPIQDETHFTEKSN
jgi:recombination protein RecT